MDASALAPPAALGRLFTPLSYAALLAVHDRDLAALGPGDYVMGPWRRLFLFPAFMTACVAGGVLSWILDRMILGRARQARINFAKRYSGQKDGVRFVLPFVIVGAVVYAGVAFLLFDTYFVVKPDEIVFDPLFGLTEVRRPYRAVLNIYDVEQTPGGRGHNSYLQRPHWVITFRDGTVWYSDDSLYGLHLPGRHARDAAMMRLIADRAGVAITRVRRFP